MPELTVNPRALVINTPYLYCGLCHRQYGGLNFYDPAQRDRELTIKLLPINEWLGDPTFSIVGGPTQKELEKKAGEIGWRVIILDNPTREITLCYTCFEVVCSYGR